MSVAPAAPGGADRRVAVCMGVRGVFARGSDGRWGLANGDELAVLEALGGSSKGADRLRAMGAALEAGVAGPGDIAELGRCLRNLERHDLVYSAKVPPYLVPAVTVACAWWNRYKAKDWLCWVLGARLESNLTDGCGVGAGWLGWDIAFTDLPRRAWWNGSEWLERLGEGFWEQLARHPYKKVRLAAEASDPDTSPARLAELAGSMAGDVLDLVCLHPRTPPSALKRLSRCPRQYSSVWRTAQNASVEPTVLRWLSKGLHWKPAPIMEPRLQRHLAMNPNTPRDALGRLSRRDDESTLGWVAFHPNAGKRTLDRLAKHESWRVRRPVAWNPSSPDRLVVRLAADKHRGVRVAVAYRRGLPGGLLEKLAGDRSLEVRAAAAANPDLCDRLVRRLARDPHPKVRRAVARREDAPQDVLDSLADDPDSGVREAVAENDSAPPTAIARLADDPKKRVQRAVAYHPAAPEEALRRFARSKDHWLRWAVAANTSCPADLLEALTGDPDPEVADTATCNPNIDAEVLERLAAHPDKLTRHAVTENPSASDRLLEQLSRDDYTLVFTSAADALAERRTAAAEAAA